jgi:molecular chaperone GrpE
MTKEQQPEEINNEKTQAAEYINESEEANNIETALAEEKNKAETYLENWKRTQADFINFKRRSELDKEDTVKFGNSLFILGLLPVLDDLQLALGSIPADMGKLPWVEGIKLIERKFNKCLDSQGVTTIKTEGEDFDPNLHQAALHVSGKEGMIIKELQKGYKMNDRVIRAAMVAVGNGNKE